MSERETNLEAMRLPELQKLFEAVVGEATRCPNRRYLIRRIVEARGGASTVDRRTQRRTAKPPKTSRPSAAAKRAAAGKSIGPRAMMVLPVRLEADLVERLDSAWRRRGLRSRMDLFRRALRAYLLSVGERDVAALVAPKP